jgi:polyisoprenoid-binding protein YceI
MKNTLLLLVAIMIFSTATAPVQLAEAQSWNVDKNHSEIGFKVRHFFTPVRGEFTDYVADINFDPADLDNSSIDVTIQVASVDTDNAKRNGHLQSADFFDAATYPTITFKSSSIKSTGDNEFVASGKLKIKDTETDFDLPFTLLGTAAMNEKTIASFTANSEINRNEYGVGSGKWVETTVVGDQVAIEIALEVNK